MLLKNYNKHFFIAWILMLSGCSTVKPKVSENASCAWKPVKTQAFHCDVDKPLFNFEGRYSLPALLELGISRNPQTRSAWWHAKRVLAQEGRAQSQFFPSITGEMDITRNQVGATNVTSKKVDQWGPALNVSYRLFQFGAGIADAKRAACALAAANYNHNFALQTLVFNVQKAYYNYASAVAAIEAQKSSLEDAEISFEAAQNKMAHGLARIQDVLLAKAEKLQAQYALQAAQATLESCKADLALAVGLPISEEFQVEVELKNVVELTGEVNDLMENALQKRADLLAAEATTRASDWENEKTKKEALPSVYLSGSIGTLRHRHWNHWQHNYNVGIGVSWNLFDGFDKQYKAMESYAVRKEQRYAFRSQQLQVLRDVWSSFHAFQSSIQLLDSAKALEEASQETLSAIRIGYDAGLNNLLDVLSAQKTLSEARLKRIKSQSDLAVNWAQLAYVSGQLDTTRFELL